MKKRKQLWVTVIDGEPQLHGSLVYKSKKEAFEETLTMKTICDDGEEWGIDRLIRLAPVARLVEAAKRLLNSLDALDKGCAEPGFAGWENGDGEPVGDEVEEARAVVKEALAAVEEAMKG